MQTLRVPDELVSAVRREVGLLAHYVGDAREWVVSETTGRHLAKKQKKLGGLPPFALDAARWADTHGRLHRMWAAMVSEPLPDSVCNEARLMLYADRALELEFMGRGAVLHERHLPAPKEQMIALDEAGGARTYVFRKLDGPSGGPTDRMTRLAQRYGVWRQWINDDGARVVVSIGGGGFRLFAATPVLKAIDRLIDGRSRVAEVWGSSGGAFLGHLYASGFPLDCVDQFAFDLYNGRVPHLVTGTVSSLVGARLRALAERFRGGELEPEMVDWLDELDKRHARATRRDSLPFYAIASSTERKGLTALSDAAFVSPHCRDFMVACEPRRAVAASTAVPFVLRPVRGIGDNPLETWFDGSISDENPLALPYIKWVREREADPERVPPRLKLVLVNLNLRTSESELLSRVGLGWQILDLLLDSKTTTNIRLVTALPTVEVMSVKLNLGWLNVKNPRDIAKAVRSGRTMESWEIEMHGRNAMEAPADGP
jgi:hypothetical protein